MIIGTLKINYPAGNKNFSEAVQKDNKKAHESYQKNMQKRAFRVVKITKQMVKDSSIDKIIHDLIFDDHFATNKFDYVYTKL